MKKFDLIFKNKKIFSFEICYLFLSYIFIIWNISLLIYLDHNKLYISAIIINKTTNLGWMFTQFTWWTNILITILQTIRIIIRNKKIKNKFLLKLLGREWYINWVTYISIVGTLFFAGALSIIIKNHNPSSMRVIKPPLPKIIFVQRIITTTFVHLINPLVYFIVLIIMMKEKLLKHKQTEVTWKNIMKKIAFGMVYPTIYIIFYIVFALLAYDPYPISDIKNGKGIWVAPFVVIVFATWLFVTWVIIKYKATVKSE